MSKDPLPCLHNSNADVLIRSRPLSDIYPFQCHGEKSAAPYLRCGAQLQPLTAGPDENRLNGINSTAWANPIVCHSEGKPQSSRIMRLFSNSKKGPVPVQSPATDSSTSTHSSGSNGGPQSWPGLAGLGVVDSFKKLRSSVLQGIQSRGAIISEGKHVPSTDQDIALDTAVASSDPVLHEANNHITQSYSISNGSFTDQNLAMSHCESDIEDYDDENDEGEVLMRNTPFTRSIKRAYGAGRISLFDMENGRLMDKSTSETIVSHKPCPTSKVNDQSENINENRNVKVLSKLSKSAENLHIFKAPFRRKAPFSGPSLPDQDPQKTATSHRLPSIQRTVSASSVDFRNYTVDSRKNSVKTKGPMLKLVGSMTDLTVRRKRSPSPSPIIPSPMSDLSRLHDDYSRRVPCLGTSERQRRPSPFRTRFLSVGHTPLIHSQPENDVPQPPQQLVLISPLSLEPPETTGPTLPSKSAHYESLTEAAATAVKCDSTPQSQNEPSQKEELTEVAILPNKVRE